jgi:hypothetical protein
LLKELNRSDDKVVSWIKFGAIGLEANPLLLNVLNSQAVVQTHGLEGRADLMISIGPLAQNVQTQINLGVTPQRNTTECHKHKKSPIVID